METILTRKFTMDDTCVYHIHNGIVTREPFTAPASYYADSSDSTGYLDKSKKWALMMYDNTIVRITRDGFMKVKSIGQSEATDIPGVISITYNYDSAPNADLGISTQYKLADREGGDFDNLNSQPKVDRTVGNTPIYDGISPLVQDLAKQNLGREVTELDIAIFRYILEAIDDHEGVLKQNELKMEEDQNLRKLIDEGHVIFSAQNKVFTVAVPNGNKLHFMRRAVEMYDGSKIVNRGKTPDPMSVASAAMNLSQQERERIGLVNQGVPERKQEENGTSRRFGGNTSESSVGFIHRPAPCPITVPVVQEKTPAFFTMWVLDKKYIPYLKPIGVKSKVCIDKRFPMYLVPMIIDDMLGYAYLKEIDKNIASKNYIPVATRYEGCYWMFRSLENCGGITFYPDVLSDYISEDANEFQGLDITGRLRIAVNNFGNMFNEDTEVEKKQEITSIYREFFMKNNTMFIPMKIDWNTGFVIAITHDGTPVLLMAAKVEGTVSDYPKFMTYIPIKDNIGLAVFGISPAEVATMEKILSGDSSYEEEDKEYDEC